MAADIRIARKDAGKIGLPEVNLGVLPGTVGLIQATEVIKLLLGLGRPLNGRLLTYDALEMTFRSFKVGRRPDCAACGPNAHIDLASIPEFVCAVQTVTKV